MGISDEQKAALKTQIVYYFSNPNIMEDAFLLEKVKSTEKGWVGADVFATFNMVKTITADVDEIMAAVTGAEGLETDAEAKAIRRVEPLPESWEPRMISHP